MADGGATATGLKELRDLVEQLPDDVTRALQTVAHDTALRCQARAKQILQSKLKTTAHALIDGIVIIPELDRQRYVVDSTPPPGQPANVPLWVERGTRFMVARPYIRPTEDAEDDRYKRDSLAAAEAVADRLEKV